MISPKSLLIYLTSNCIYRTVYSYQTSPEEAIKFEEASLVELRLFENPSKALSKREQFEITDIIKDWIREFSNVSSEESGSLPEHQLQVVVSSDFSRLDGSETILHFIRSHGGCEEHFTIAEETRQSFLGLKYYCLNIRNLNTRLLYLNLKSQETCLLAGDSHLLHRCSTVKIGIQQIAHFISKLRETDSLQTLGQLIRANFFLLCEQNRFTGSSQVIALDEDSSRLLARTFGKEIAPQKIVAEDILHLSQKIIDSRFDYFRSVEYIDSESVDYASAHVVLLASLIEGLGAQICLLAPDLRFKGYIVHNALEENKLHEHFAGHLQDWKKGAKELLLRCSPEDLVYSLQIADLGIKVFESSEGWLHLWGLKEKKYLWLSCFLYKYLSGKHLESSAEILSQIYGLNKAECQLLACIVAMASQTENIIEQSRYLEHIPAELRSLARQIASLASLASSLNITGRSAIQNVSLQANPRESNGVTLKIMPRLDISAEMVQLQTAKRMFEANFEQKVELEVARSSM